MLAPFAPVCSLVETAPATGEYGIIAWKSRLRPAHRPFRLALGHNLARSQCKRRCRQAMA
jgi:hypothetical protein